MDSEEYSYDNKECVCSICKFDGETIFQSCGHFICNICLDKVAIFEKNCRICKSEISPSLIALKTEYFSNPVNKLLVRFGIGFGKVWCYAGNHCKWLYNKSQIQKINNGYAKYEIDDDPKFELILDDGSALILDFEEMVQYRKSDPGKRRNIYGLDYNCREDIEQAKIVGVSGIKL